MLNLFRLMFAILIVVVQPLFGMSKAPSQEVSVPADAIGVRTLRYEDEKRSRPVVVEVWYPKEVDASSLVESPDPIWIHPKEVRDVAIERQAAPYPLIVMSHGHRGDRRERSWLADFLVRRGFVVAAVEHFGNTWNYYKPFISLRFWERSRDVSFALDRLLSDPWLQGMIDPQKIGFVGYSLGGLTGLSLAGAQARNTKETILRFLPHVKEVSRSDIEQVDFSQADQSYKEPRIRSMLLLCPALFIFPPESLRQIQIPVGLVAAINDEVLPHKEHAAQLIQHLASYKLKLMRKEISHYAFLNRLTEKGRKIVQKRIPNDPPCCDRVAVHREVAAFAVDFFQETLRTSNGITLRGSAP